MKTLINGTFYSMKDTEIKSTLMISDQGVILSKSDNTKNEIIDMKGKFVYPAFIDSHIHLMGYGQSLSRLTVKGLNKKKDILKFVADNLNNDFIYVEGYKPCDISKNDLNELSSIAAIYLRHEDYHGMTVNDVALDKINLISNNGILLEDEASLALASVPRPKQEELENFLRKAYKKLFSYGIVGGHSDDLFYFNGYKNTIDAFTKISYEIPFYAHLLIHNKVLNDHIKLKENYFKSKYIEEGGVKMFYDGTLGSKTALMKKPYYNDYYGIRILNREQITKIINKAREKKMSVAIHVIGDKALEETISFLQEFPPGQDIIDRIIHACFANDEEIHNLKSKSIFLDIQPQFFNSDKKILNFIKDMPKYIYPIKTFDKNNIDFALSSDAPVEDPNPIFGIYDALFRENKDESLDRFTAIKSYTTSAWKLSKLLGGYLEPGYPANLVVLNRDLFHEPKENFRKIKVLSTWVEGNKVYTT